MTKWCCAGGGGGGGGLASQAQITDPDASVHDIVIMSQEFLASLQLYM